ncbi:LppP/LprE family lipoprotein [Nocardia sp. NPDC058666]|uniref:LppP/LprE family lipoprotein n=1 Tax=Nocardia sp. NPDC058666 TaxID=3346587 RepID=UPI003653A478
MSILIVLATLVSVVSDASIPRWMIPAGESRGFSYATPSQFVVIRDGAVLATAFGVFRHDDPVAWTNSGDFVAFVSNPPQAYAESRELVYIDANSGAEQRLPCTGCTELIPFERNSIVATQTHLGRQTGFMRFDLAAPAPGVKIDVGDPVTTSLESGSNFRLLTTQTSPGSYMSRLSFISTPTYTQSLIETIPRTLVTHSATAPSGERMGEKFLYGGDAPNSSGRCDSRPLISFIVGDGSPRMTDVSTAGPLGFGTDRQSALRLDDVWSGPDGRFHATFTERRCTGEAQEVGESRPTVQISPTRDPDPNLYREPALWTLDEDSLRWIPEHGAPAARMTRYLGSGEAIQLRSPSCEIDPTACRRGNLYHSDGTGDYLVATNVMTIAAQPKSWAPAETSCPIEVPGVGIADVVSRRGDVDCERAKRIHAEYEYGHLPRSGNAEHAGTSEWHCSSPTVGRRASTGIIVACQSPPTEALAWEFDIVAATCGTDLWSPLINAAITMLPIEPTTRASWSRDPRTFEGNYDPCKPLSAVVVTIDGATGSSPDQVLLFRKGVFLGTATPESHGFTSLDFQQTTDDTVALLYKVPGTCNACSDATYFSVEMHWNGSGLDARGTPPPN